MKYSNALPTGINLFMTDLNDMLKNVL